MLKFGSLFLRNQFRDDSALYGWVSSFFTIFFFRIRFRKTQPALAVRPLTPNPYTALIEFTSGYSGDWKPLTVCFFFFMRFAFNYVNDKAQGSYCVLITGQY